MKSDKKTNRSKKDSVQKPGKGRRKISSDRPSDQKKKTGGWFGSLTAISALFFGKSPADVPPPHTDPFLDRPDLHFT